MTALHSAVLFKRCEVSGSVFPPSTDYKQQCFTLTSSEMCLSGFLYKRSFLLFSSFSKLNMSIK